MRAFLEEVHLFEGVYPGKSVIFGHLFGISIEVEIRHGFPCNLSADAATHAENLPCQHPPHQTNRVCTFVIARDCHIHVAQWRVCVAECNNWNIHIGCFCYRLKKVTRLLKNNTLTCNPFTHKSDLIDFTLSNAR